MTLALRLNREGYIIFSKGCHNIRVQDPGKLNDLFDGSGADATGANVTTLHFSVFFEPNLLQIGQPPVAGQVVSVTHPVSVLGAFIADRALPAHGTPPNIEYRAG
jgi:hypothetical protein